MFRNVAKTFFRRYSSHSMSAETGTHDTKMWKYLSFLVILPVGACYVNAHIEEQEEQENWEHHRPEYRQYTHMRLRSKQFPWGDGNHTLFHNPKVNALPDGYEM